MARAFSGLETLAILARFHGTSDLCAGLAACCPHLRSLKVHKHFWCLDAIGSLMALRGLTSLQLRDQEGDEQVDEEDPNTWHTDDRVWGPASLMQQLSALSALTHLVMDLSVDWDSVGLGSVLPPLGHTQLRSLELNSAYLFVNDFPALAAAFPRLEQLRCTSLEDPYIAMGRQAALGAEGRVGWCMPHLRAICAEERRGNQPDVEAALCLAEGCPALRSLSNVTVALSWKRSQEQGAGQDAAAVALRWLQGLSTLAARGLLPDVWLTAASAHEAEGFCIALEQFQPADRRPELVAHIRMLIVDDVAAAESTLGRLVSHLPHLRRVICLPWALPVVAHLRHLSQASIKLEWLAGHDVPTAAAECEAANSFAEQRAAALHPSATACPAARFEDPLPPKTHAIVSIWDKSARCFEVWEVLPAYGYCKLRRRNP